MSLLWPAASERHLIGRFYLSGGISETFNVIWPFQFAYLLMVMEQPQWAVLPLIAEAAVMLLLQVPSGAWADRYSRRRVVISGGLVNVAALLLVPLATRQTGQVQLLAVLACFGIWGLGQAMVSGALEAWVVDNLLVAGRRDLVGDYFARINSFASVGAVGAGAVALVLLITLDISRGLLDGLWYIAALGSLAGTLILLRVGEYRPPTADETVAGAGHSWRGMLAIGLRLLRRSRRLSFFVLALVVASFPEAATDDAFDMSLITKGMDARGLAPLGILDNVIAMTAPLIGLALMRRYGASPVLALFLVLPAVAVSTLFFAAYLWLLIILYVLLDFFDCVWDPVASAHLQSMLPSQTRATAVSMVGHAGGLVELLGIAVFAWLLGEHSAQLGAAVPDLVTAFSGLVSVPAAAPQSGLGLAIPDLAIVIFVGAALLALPFLGLSARSREAAADEAAPISAQARIESLQRIGMDTPAFVFDTETLRADARRSRDLVRDDSTRLLFALKSYSVVAGLEIIADEVDGFAASSLYEARLARDILGSGKTVHLTTPGLRADEIVPLCEIVDYLSFNSLNQWHRHKDQVRGRLSAGLRVNPQLSFVRDARYDPCREGSKLGIPLSELQALAQQSPERLQGVEGLHIHSNCDSNDLSPLQDTVDRLTSLIEPLSAQIEWINLGGGYMFNDPVHTRALAETKARLRQCGDFRIFIEPGAAIARRAGYFVASVVDIFHSGEQRIAVLDTSVNHMPEVFEYQFEPDVVGDGDNNEHEYLLAGSACLAGDLFGVYAFAEPLRIGSRILFANLGAYSLVKANMFNGINLPTIYAMNEAGELERVRRYDYRDFRILCGD